METLQENEDTKDKMGKCVFLSSLPRGMFHGPLKAYPHRFPELRMKTYSEFNMYMQKCKESGGFDITGCTGSLCGGIVETDDTDLQLIQDIRKCTKFAVQYQNDTKKTDLEYWGLVRANAQMVSGLLFYITLRAGHKEGNHSEVYRTLVWKQMSLELKVKSFELAPEFEQNTQEWLVPVPSSRKRKDGNAIVAPPFVAFVRKLRNKPEFVGMKYRDVMRIASTEWRSMSALDKARFTQEIPIIDIEAPESKPVGPSRKRNRKFNIILECGFYAFVNHLRKNPELVDKTYRLIEDFALTKWSSISTQEKIRFIEDLPPHIRDNDMYVMPRMSPRSSVQQKSHIFLSVPNEWFSG